MHGIINLNVIHKAESETQNPRTGIDLALLNCINNILSLYSVLAHYVYIL